MTEQKKILKTFKPFILGTCACGCNESIPVRNKRDLLARFKHAHNCKRENNPNWKRGWYTTPDGYRKVKKPDHPFSHCDGHVLNHRLVMEQCKGRYLTRKEVVHHIIPVSEGGTDDIENLMLFANHAEHRRYELTKDMSNRFCLLCGRKTRVEKDGFEHWYKHEDGFICNKCYKKKTRKSG